MLHMAPGERALDSKVLTSVLDKDVDILIFTQRSDLKASFDNLHNTGRAADLRRNVHSLVHGAGSCTVRVGRDDLRPVVLQQLRLCGGTCSGTSIFLRTIIRGFPLVFLTVCRVRPRVSVVRSCHTPCRRVRWDCSMAGNDWFSSTVLSTWHASGRDLSVGIP